MEEKKSIIILSPSIDLDFALGDWKPSVGAFLIVKHTHAVSLNVHGTHYDHTCEHVFVIVPSVQRCREDSNSTDTTEQDKCHRDSVGVWHVPIGRKWKTKPPIKLYYKKYYTGTDDVQIMCVYSIAYSHIKALRGRI